MVINELSGLENLNELKQKVIHIRQITNRKPVGIKFASGHIEEDIEFALKAEIDYITIDCRGGATGSSLKFLKDDVGIPPVFAIRRARKYSNKINSDLTLFNPGGFRNSADVAKAITLGAGCIRIYGY